MSLCISYRTENGKAIVVSDSRLTTTGKNDKSVESAAFLPSNQKILHQTDYGIKVQILTQKESGSTYSEFNVIVSIAGNVSLGLQCLAHIDACLQGNDLLWAESIPSYIEDKILLFWNNARDQTLQMSFTLNNHKGATRIFELNADENIFEFKELQEENGILLSVIGDNADNVKNDIFLKINSKLYTNGNLNVVIHTSVLSTLSNIMKNETDLYVGGKIQGAIFNNDRATYLKIKDIDGFTFRTAEIEDYEIEILKFPLLDLTDEFFPVINNKNNFEVKDYYI